MNAPVRILLALFAAFLSGCDGASDSTGNGVFGNVVGPPRAQVQAPERPAVESTNPADGASGVPRTTFVEITFTKDMDPATLNSSTILVSEGSGVNVAGVVSYNRQTRVATFVPNTPLSDAQAYSVSVTTEVLDSTELSMASSHAFSFSTGSGTDTTAPTFGGAINASAADHVSLDLMWNEAQDDQAAANAIQYRVYSATTSGGQNFSTPTDTSGPGATAFTLRGLNPSTTYYIVVRAVDPSGNEDQNTVEVSAATQPGTLISYATDIVATIWTDPSNMGGACNQVVACHGTDKDGGLDLQTYSASVAGGSSQGPGATPYSPTSSSLFTYVSSPSNFGNSTASKHFMSDAEKNMIKQWILEGARDN